DFCARYGALRLPRESLVVARVPRQAAQRLVDHFQRDGSAAVFVLADPSAPPAPKVEPKKDRLLAKLRREEMKFTGACRDLEEALPLNHSQTAAAEWMLDNAYLVTTHASELRRHLPRHASKLVEWSQSGSHLHRLAQALVVRTDRSLTESNII